MSQPPLSQSTPSRKRSREEVIQSRATGRLCPMAAGPPLDEWSVLRLLAPLNTDSGYHRPDIVSVYRGSMSQFCVNNHKLPPLARDADTTFATLAVVCSGVWLASAKNFEAVPVKEVWLDYILYAAAWIQQLSRGRWATVLNSPKMPCRPTTKDVCEMLQRVVVPPSMPLSDIAFQAFLRVMLSASEQPNGGVLLESIRRINVAYDDFQVVFYDQREQAEERLRDLVRASDTSLTPVNPLHGQLCGFVIASAEHTFGVSCLEGALRNPHSNDVAPPSCTLLLFDSHGMLPWSNKMASIAAVDVPLSEVTGHEASSSSSQKDTHFFHFSKIVFALLDAARRKRRELLGQPVALEHESSVWVQKAAREYTTWVPVYRNAATPFTPVSMPPSTDLSIHVLEETLRYYADRDQLGKLEACTRGFTMRPCSLPRQPPSHPFGAPTPTAGAGTALPASTLPTPVVALKEVARPVPPPAAPVVAPVVVPGVSVPAAAAAVSPVGATVATVVNDNSAFHTPERQSTGIKGTPPTRASVPDATEATGESSPMTPATSFGDLRTVSTDGSEPSTPIRRPSVVKLKLKPTASLPVLNLGV